MVLDAAVECGVIPREEADRQIEMLEKATEVEKTRGMAQGKYIKPKGRRLPGIGLNLCYFLKSPKILCGSASMKG